MTKSIDDILNPSPEERMAAALEQIARELQTNRKVAIEQTSAILQRLDKLVGSK